MAGLFELKRVHECSEEDNEARGQDNGLKRKSSAMLFRMMSPASSHESIEVLKRQYRKEITNRNPTQSRWEVTTSSAHATTPKCTTLATSSTCEAAQNNMESTINLIKTNIRTYLLSSKESTQEIVGEDSVSSVSLDIINVCLELILNTFSLTLSDSEFKSSLCQCPPSEPENTQSLDSKHSEEVDPNRLYQYIIQEQAKIRAMELIKGQFGPEKTVVASLSSQGDLLQTISPSKQVNTCQKHLYFPL